MICRTQPGRYNSLCLFRSCWRLSIVDCILFCISTSVHGIWCHTTVFASKAIIIIIIIINNKCHVLAKNIRNLSNRIKSKQDVNVFKSDWGAACHCPQRRKNMIPIQSRGNYSTTSNSIKLVQWLLHLVQQGEDWEGPQPAQAPSRCTKCNSPPINGQCTNHRIAVYE